MPELITGVLATISAATLVLRPTLVTVPPVFGGITQDPVLLKKVPVAALDALGTYPPVMLVAEVPSPKVLAVTDPVAMFN